MEIRSTYAMGAAEKQYCIITVMGNMRDVGVKDCLNGISALVLNCKDLNLNNLTDEFHCPNSL